MSEKETRFTPGPWFSDGGTVFVDSRYQECCGKGVGECCGSPDVLGDYFQIAETSTDNASLIAAAPDLYEAAKQGREAAAKLAEHYRHAYDSDREIEWCRVVDRCDAALSKALGENKPCI